MYKMNETPLSREELAALLHRVDGARVGLIGDLCLDLYWLADMKLSELSRETPHYPLPIVEERFAPGGAGNVATNIFRLSELNPVPSYVVSAQRRYQGTECYKAFAACECSTFNKR